MNSKATLALVIASLVGLACCVENSGDVYTMGLYVRENDVFRLNIDKLIPFYSSSINFSCENTNIYLPGLPVSKNSKKFHYPESMKIDIFRSIENSFFVISNGSKNINNFKIDKDGHVSMSSILIDSRDELHKDDQSVVFDLVIIDPNNYAVFYYYRNDFSYMKKEGVDYPYYLMIYDHTRKERVCELTINLPWLDNIKVILLSNHENVFRFAIFGRDEDRLGKFDSSKAIHFLKIDCGSLNEKSNSSNKSDTENQNLKWSLQDPSEANDKVKTNECSSKTKSKRVYDVLFWQEKKAIQLIDIFYKDEYPSMIFFHIKLMEDNEIKQHIKSCEFDPVVLDIADHSFPLSCKELKISNVSHFYMEAPYYIYLTTNDEIFFCIDDSENYNNYCKKGVYQRDWQIGEVLFKGPIAVVTIFISKVKITFINDFIKNTLVWFYEQESEEEIIRFLITRKLENGNRTYFVNFSENSIFLTDITVSKMLEIDANNIRSIDNIQVHLEEHKVIDLNIKFWDGKNIVDLDENTKRTIIKSKSGFFRTKIGFAGSNLHFRNDDNKPTIRYFNQLNYSIQFKDGFTLGSRPFFIFKEWLFLEDLVINMKCDITYEDLSMICIEVERKSLKNPLAIDKIKKVQKLGSLLYFEEKEDSPLNEEQNSSQKKPPSKKRKRYFFDTITQEQYLMKHFNLIRGHRCKFYNIFILCAINQKVKQKSSRRRIAKLNILIQAEEIKLFILNKNDIQEASKLNKDFMNEISMNIFGSEIKSKILHVKINDFGMDFVDHTKISIMFLLVDVYENYSNHLINFKIGYDKITDLESYRIEISDEKFEINKNENIKQKTQMNVLDSQYIFTTFEPSFKIFCYDRDSYFEFEYLDIQKVTSFIVLESVSLISVIYQSHEDNLFYHALYRVTQNAVKQLIRNENLPYYSSDFRVDFNRINEHTMAIIQYNFVTGDSYNSYLYYQNGPYLFSNDHTKDIYIDDKVFNLNLIEDENFSSNLVMNIKDNLIIIEPFMTSKEIVIKDYFKITGSIKNMSLFMEDNKTNSIVTLKQALTLVADKSIISLDSFDPKRPLIIKEGNKFIIFQNSLKRTSFTIRSKSKHIKDVKKVFKIDAYNGCDYIKYSERSLFCFWTNLSFSKVSVLSLQDIKEEKQRDFILARPTRETIVFEDTDKKISMIGCDFYNKFIMITQINLENDFVFNKFIGKHEMHVDDIKIADFFYRTYEANDKLVIIMLDILSNQLLIFYGSLKTLDQFHVLKRMISLEKIHRSVLRIECREINETPQFKCFLISTNKVYKTMITFIEEAEISLFKWKFEMISEAYNVLYENSFDEKFELSTQVDDDHLFMYEKHLESLVVYKEGDVKIEKSENDNFLAMYDFSSSNPNFSQFVLDLKSLGYILLMKPITLKNGQKGLNLYYYNNKALRRAQFEIGDYKIMMKIKNLKKNEDLKYFEVIVNFINGNTNSLKLHLEFKKPQQKDDPSFINEQSAYLVAIVIIFFFILCMMFTLIFLISKWRGFMREANDLEMKDESDAASIVAENSMQE
jgi:hypothetical protein